MPAHVILVDDHPLFRQALATTVSNVDAGIDVSQYDSLTRVREALERDAAVALVLLDLRLPDSSGMSGLLSLQARFPQVPIAIVSANDDAETVQAAFTCGAAGFISKASTLQELTEAIGTLLQGRRWFPAFSQDEDRAELTATQTRILDGLHRGLMNKQIAFELGLSEATVKYHLTGIFRKLGARTRAQLVGLARDRSMSA